MAATTPMGPLRGDDLDAARGLFGGAEALVDALRTIRAETGRTEEAYRAVVRSLAVALSARDGYTGEHSGTVHRLSIAVARRLGLDGRAVAEVEAVALLHDIGKIGIRDHVLHKPGPLDDAEWAAMREHPLIGERILRPLPGLSDVATAVRHEHERWDGGGYPDGLAGEAIPLASRIVLACDAYDALVSDRPYRGALVLSKAIEELRRCSGCAFDPHVVEALIACLDEHGNVVSHGDAVDFTELLGPSEGDSDARRLEREVHALIAVASAVATVEQLDDLIEVTAEEACRGVDASSLSIGRWEADARVLRIVVNVGDLSEWEERRPADETYRLEDDDAMRTLLVEGQSYITVVDDPEGFVLERELLRNIGKHSCVAVPIMLGSTPWGELWAARDHGRPVFNDHDVRFLQTLAGQVTAAVGRTELFDRMADLAFRDPLTGVGNRRSLEERLELAAGEARGAGRDLTVLLCDVDNLKELNDAHGHAAGDDALRRVASALVAEAAAGAESMVYRLGGDEFCLVLDGARAEDGLAAGERVLERLASAPGPSASFGVASLALGSVRSPDLLRSADAALYTAKRSGRGRVCLAGPSSGPGSGPTPDRPGPVRRRGRRQARDRREVDLGVLLPAVLGALDGELGHAGTLERLQGLVAHVGNAVDAARGALSFRPHGVNPAETSWTVDFRAGRTWSKRPGGRDGCGAFDGLPATARRAALGGSFLIDAAEPGTETAERRLLRRLGVTAVLGASVTDARGAWLVEVYADGDTLVLDTVEPALRLLAAEAVKPRRDSAPARGLTVSDDPVASAV